MTPYHKIDSLFKRDKDGNMLWGEYSRPEFAYLSENTWMFTEKIDGTNIRVMIDTPSRKVTFGGRTDNAQIPAKLYTRLAEMFGDHSRLFDQFPDGACLYGEGYGDGIQKAGKLYGDINFILFDVKIGNWWLTREDREAVAESIGINIVPVRGSGPLRALQGMVEGGIVSYVGDRDTIFFAEGLIAEPVVPLFDRGGRRIITKLKARDYR